MYGFPGSLITLSGGEMLPFSTVSEMLRRRHDAWSSPEGCW